MPVSKAPKTKRKPVKTETATDAPEGALYAWAFEEKALGLGRKGTTVAAAVLGGSALYSLVQGSFLPAMLFLLIGLIGWRVLHAAPRAFRCFLTGSGFFVNAEFFPYDRFQSFWFFTEGEPELSFKPAGGLSAGVKMPVPLADIEAIRSVLLASLPEEEQELSFVDSLEKMLHI